MIDAIRKPIREFIRQVLHFYPFEYGKYSILMKLYFPFLAPIQPEKKIVRLKTGFRMALELNEYLQSQLYLFGNFEPTTVEILKRLVKSGNTVLDIGANVGYIALELANIVGKRGKVFAFEPDTKNYMLLNENINLNPSLNIVPFPIAVTEIGETVRLYHYKFDFNNSAHSTLPGEKHASDDFIEIPSISIDDFVQKENIKKVDTIKIDIEGAEMQAFKGMKDTLKHHRPLVLCELCEEHQSRAGYTTSEIKHWLYHEFGLSPFIMTNSNFLVPVSLEESHVADNVVFIPSEHIPNFTHLIQK